MTLTDRRKLYKDLKIKLNNTFSAIAVDKDSYLVGIASNKVDLKDVLNNEKTCKIILTDDLGSIIVSYDVRKTDYFTEVNLLTSLERQILEDNPSDSDLEILANNSSSFVTNLEKFLLRYFHIDTERRSISLGVSKKSFERLLVYTGNLTFCLSDIQMSIVTGDNCVVIHDKYRDIEYQDILDLLSDNLRIKRYELREFLKQPYSS
ncbi:hypothetical protein COF68_06085 [Bacillus toyonensis]|uniref:hypothetical protein n=1 Tax=Bacillus toyonensis TaxID=155322 RepID=UPI000BFE97AA|nr:hypothetical protein [Bacillus toyonensis]PHE64403.1 hypothetical protein COF68_06085 [Bacillus toyonensis]